IAERQGQGVRLLFRPQDAANAARRAARFRDRLRIPQLGRTGPGAGTRKYRPIRPHERLLDKLRQKRKSEWAGAPRMACLYRLLAAGHVLRWPFELSTGSEHHANQSHGRLLCVAARTGQGTESELKGRVTPRRSCWPSVLPAEKFKEARLGPGMDSSKYLTGSFSSKS